MKILFSFFYSPVGFFTFSLFLFFFYKGCLTMYLSNLFAYFFMPTSNRSSNSTWLSSSSIALPHQLSLVRNIGITEIGQNITQTIVFGCVRRVFGLGHATALLVGFHDGMLDNVATEDSSSDNDDVLEVWSCGVLELISWTWTTPCVFFLYSFAVW